MSRTSRVSCRRPSVSSRFAGGPVSSLFRCGGRGGPCGVGALAEVCLQAPEIVEMLARPEQDERGIHRCFVVAARGVADAPEKLAAALGVADVWGRHLASVDERVSERDVPGLEGLELATEVAGAALEPVIAVRHTCECRKRLRPSKRLDGSRRAVAGDS